ncbi:cellulose biosynthesis protein BcsQ [Sphingobium fontiphilum]|uniref:Cellulose biosynthesis protein BcsQ n=1 Tax=Sphingobium fontiphilum TaxID=944425 RepID=A0A7W6DJD0_9SPHN|nr:ParA family protein [Sphingobium fontiphilum]MBB3980923.1 cellulose biosynthesis protein BcsQ [Sphingobium fontiphilum]
MAAIAIFNSKGGVGKTTIAIQLASEAAASGHNVLLWEVDEGADSSWILSRGEGVERPDLDAVADARRALADFVRPSAIPGVSLIAGDPNMRRSDNFLARLWQERRQAHWLHRLNEAYDIILIDCAPGFSEANRKIMLLADLIVVPTVPSALSMRGLLRVRHFLTRHRDGRHPPMLPVFSMVDRRRSLHKAALAKYPAWPTIPMASLIEQMAERRAPLTAFAAGSAAREGFRILWAGIERKLRHMGLVEPVVQRAAAEGLPNVAVAV